MNNAHPPELKDDHRQRTPADLAGQVVVITGASNGIGRAAALLFAHHGAHVVCAARGRVALLELTEQIIAQGGSARAIPTDVSDPASVAALVQASVAAYGGIDVWINNAGLHAYGGVEDLLIEDYERMILVNYLGQVYGTCAALPVLRRSATPVLMGLVGRAGFSVGPHSSAGYAASKFALRGFYLNLQRELANKDERVSVVMIHPDAVATPMYRHSRHRGHGQAHIPARMYHPQVVAQAMLYAAVHPRRQVFIGGHVAAALATGWAAPSVHSVWAQARTAAAQFGIGQRLPDWVQQLGQRLVLTNSTALPAQQPPHPAQALVRTLMGSSTRPAATPGSALDVASADTFEQASPAPGQVSDELPATVRGWSRYAVWSGHRQQAWGWARAHLQAWWDAPIREQLAQADRQRQAEKPAGPAESSAASAAGGDDAQADVVAGQRVVYLHPQRTSQRVTFTESVLDADGEHHALRRE